MNEREILKGVTEIDAQELMALARICYADARLLIYYLSLDGVLVPLQTEGRYRVEQSALVDPFSIPYAKCVLLGEEFWALNPYAYPVIAKRQSFVPADELDQSTFAVFEKHALIYQEQGIWHHRVPLGTRSLIADVSSHYNDYAFLYRVAYPMLYAMSRGENFSETILRSPLFPRGKRALLRMLLEEYRQYGIDLSPKDFAGSSDMTESFMRFFTQAVFCEFDCSCAEEYVSAVSPYCQVLFDSPFVPKEYKEGMRSALLYLKDRKEKQIAFDRSFYRRSFLPEAVPDVGVFDDALF